MNLLEAPWGAGYGVESWLDESERCLSWCARGARVSLPFSAVHVDWTEIPCDWSLGFWNRCGGPRLAGIQAAWEWL